MYKNITQWEYYSLAKIKKISFVNFLVSLTTNNKHYACVSASTDFHKYFIDYVSYQYGDLFSFCSAYVMWSHFSY